MSGQASPDQGQAGHGPATGAQQQPSRGPPPPPPPPPSPPSPPPVAGIPVPAPPPLQAPAPASSSSPSSSSGPGRSPAVSLRPAATTRAARGFLLADQVLDDDPQDQDSDSGLTLRIESQGQDDNGWRRQLTIPSRLNEAAAEQQHSKTISPSNSTPQLPSLSRQISKKHASDHISSPEEKSGKSSSASANLAPPALPSSTAASSSGSGAKSDREKDRHRDKERSKKYSSEEALPRKKKHKSKRHAQEAELGSSLSTSAGTTDGHDTQTRAKISSIIMEVDPAIDNPLNLASEPSGQDLIGSKASDSLLQGSETKSSHSVSSRSSDICEVTGSFEPAASNSIAVTRPKGKHSSGSTTQGSKDKERKKKSWYSALYPTYKSRSADFKKVFGNIVPADERLIVEYSCALQRDILVHGRLYLTRNFACFYANILKWETQMHIRWAEIVSVTKEKTALVIPNAIQLNTEKEKFFFASFAARDKSYDMMEKIRKSARENSVQSFSNTDLWDLIHEAYGDELGLTSDDEYQEYQNHSPQSPFTPSASTPNMLSTTKKSGMKVSQEKTKDKDQKESGNASEVECPLVLVNGKSPVEDTSSSRGPDFVDNGSNLSSSLPLDPEPLIEQESAPQLRGDAQPAAAIGQDNSAAVDKSPGGERGQNANFVKAKKPKKKAKKFGAVASAGTLVGTKSSGAESGINSRKSELSDSSDDESSKIIDDPQGDVRALLKKPDANMQKGADKAIKLAAATFERWKASVEGKETVNEVFSVDVDTLFTMLFTLSKFYMDFHNRRKTTDIVDGRWQSKAGTEDKYRELTMTLSQSNPIGPKSFTLNETQIMLSDYSTPGQTYAIRCDQVNSGIPYADYFYLQADFCLTKIGPNETRLTVYNGIKYNKSPWGFIKGIIEKNTWNGLNDSYDLYVRMLNEECDNLPSNSNSLSGAAVNQEAGSRIKSKKTKAGSGGPGTALNGHGPASAGSFGASDSLRGKDPNLIRGQSSTSSAAPSGILGSLTGMFKPPTSMSTMAFLLVVFMLFFTNVFIIYKMAALETNISKSNQRVTDLHRRARQMGLGGSDGQSGWVDPALLLQTAGTEVGMTPKTQEEWINLLQKQELMHQMELDKWHDMLGTATELLRKTEQSLSNLQRSIHPLTLQKLKGILLVQQESESMAGVQEPDKEKATKRPAFSQQKSNQEAKKSEL